MTLSSLVETASGWSLTAQAHPLSLSVVDNGILSPRLIRDGIDDLQATLRSQETYSWLSSLIFTPTVSAASPVRTCGDTFITVESKVLISIAEWQSSFAYDLAQELPASDPVICTGEDNVTLACPLGQDIIAQTSKGLYRLKVFCKEPTMTFKDPPQADIRGLCRNLVRYWSLRIVSG